MANNRSLRILSRAALVAFSFLLWVPTVVAQNASEEPTAFQLQRFRPQGDPAGTFQAQSGKTLREQWRLFASLYLHYSKDPLVLRRLDGSRFPEGDVLSHQLGADFLAGVAVLKWLDVRLRVPLTLFQAGALPDAAFIGDARGRDLSGFAAADLSLMGKAQVLQQKKYFVDLSLQLQLGLPSGNSQNFNGEGFAWVGLQAFVSRSFLKNRLQILFNLGFHLFPPTKIFNLVFANELSYALSAKYRLLPGTLDLIAELSGATSFSSETSAQTSPFDWTLGARWKPFKALPTLSFDGAIGGGMSFGAGSPQFRFLLGVTWVIQLADADKDGLPAQWDRCPSRAGPRENRGCPWPDRDGDGVADKDDKCPSKKGEARRAGCPPPPKKKPLDTDKDGVPDSKDKCPKKDGPISNKGCPFPDTDKDGLPDDKDRCPKKKGLASNAGCPAKDSDGDGVLDNVDQCPYLPANSLSPASSKRKAGKKRKARKKRKTRKKRKARKKPKARKKQKDPRPGCPARVLVKVSKTKIVPLKPLGFRGRRSTRLLRSSRLVLQQIADVLNANKKARLKIEVHTDNRLGRRKSLFVTIRQALTLKKSLVKAGVSAKHVEALGFGSSKPVSPNNSSRGRRKNRRILLLLKGL